MMNKFEEAVIYATVMHTGAIRKGRGTPYILHPLEVAQIISTMTDDIDVLSAGVLHDVVEDTDGSMEEIRARFGDRVADIVSSEDEDKHLDMDPTESWHLRKEESLIKLKNSKDIGVRILWLADKLSNMRSIADMYRKQGEAAWQSFHMKDAAQQQWYYKAIAEELEMDLNRTGAFKELVQHINFIWPGTFSAEKARFKKYREYSVEGCPVIGRGAKSVVYRYNDEVIIKVYNKKNTYKEIERENAISRKAFIAGIPTAISFGIVKVGECYGSMFELLNSQCISEIISKDPGSVDTYADLMADLAKNIHTTSGRELEIGEYIGEVRKWIKSGLDHADEALAGEVMALVDALPKVDTLIHGDFHTGNVMMQNGEPLLIDMDRLSIAHPIVEISGLYMFYVGFGELDHSFSENFMGFSYEVQGEFFDEFLKRYLGTKNRARINEVKNKAALLAYARLVHRVYKKGLKLNKEQIKDRNYYVAKVRKLLKKVDSLDF